MKCTDLSHLREVGRTAFETLQPRRFLSASTVYEPHATVNGETLQQWTVDWWQKVFSIPVYASDGSTLVNPQWDEAPAHALPSDSGGVEFLFGSFFSGTHQRHDTVPSNTPIFVPVFNTEWSSADT